MLSKLSVIDMIAGSSYASCLGFSTSDLERLFKGVLLLEEDCSFEDADSEDGRSEVLLLELLEEEDDELELDELGLLFLSGMARELGMYLSLLVLGFLGSVGVCTAG